ncbi:response regulator transcription factor, partial [Pseudomonas viridiflava]
AQGKSNKEIGDSLLLSNKTISTYKTRLQLKLNAFNLVALVDFAKRNGLG